MVATDDPLRHALLRALGARRDVRTLADDSGVTDARVLWHLNRLHGDGLVQAPDAADGSWRRTPTGDEAAARPAPVAEASAFPASVVAEFEQAFRETSEGMYGPSFAQGVRQHRGRLSLEQAREFNERLQRLVEEYFRPGRGDRAGVKYGFYAVLTPIDLHPLGDEAAKDGVSTRDEGAFE